MPRPRSLTAPQIADAARALVAREGLPVLSMRTVAAELGVSAMSLYRYVRSRDEIEGLLVDAVLRGIDTDLPARLGWRNRVIVLVERARDAMRAQPALVPMLLTRRHGSAGSVRWGEAMMRALADGGFAGERRALTFRTLLAYLTGAVQVEHFGPLSGKGTAALARLPASEFPYLSETARSARGISPDREFRAGLEAVLLGLEGGAARR